MPRKKQEELEAEGTSAEVNQDETAVETTEEVAVEAAADENAGTATEEKPERTTQSEETEEVSVVDSVFETVSSVVGSAVGAVADGVSAVVSAVTADSSTAETGKAHHSKRAEKIGIVQSDKMTNTVTVRVDRLVKHPIYRKYVKRRKKFMAHDEKGAAVGDKVRIVETRPLSARKRWRVIEIIQKAVK